MEVTTIVGIVVAVIIMIIGLKLLLKRSTPAEPSLESELHIDSQSNQPIIPRHVRDQLPLKRLNKTSVKSLHCRRFQMSKMIQNLRL